MWPWRPSWPPAREHPCARPVGAGMVRSLRTCRVAGVQVSPPANGVTGPRACVPGGPRPAFPEALQELLTARGSHVPPARLPFFIQLVFQFVSEANVRGAALHWPEKEEALPRAHESSGRGSGCPGAWCQSRAWTSAMGHCTQMDRQARCSRQVAAWEVVTPMG